MSWLGWIGGAKWFTQDNWPVRISETPAQGSEARRGVGTAVESNTADKSGVEMGKVNSVDEKEARCQICGGDVWKNAEPGIVACASCGLKRVTPEREAELRKQFANEGSAETGGEKAAPPINVHDLWGWYGMLSLLYYRADIRNWGTIGMPHKEEVLGVIAQFERACKELDKLEATSRRPSQNQTASSGVEGAHEGTTADENGSRAPEKLNNAQKMDAESTALADLAMNEQVALAESSLSSPPPKKDDLSAPTSPEGTGLSIEQAESRTAKETR